MKVLVDTSVWVDFFNGLPSPQADALERLLRGDGDVATCGVIVSEVLQGMRREPPDLRRRFTDLQWLRPREPDTYFAAADLFRALRKQGVTIPSTIDCLLVTLAEEHAAWLLAKDRDLTQVIKSGLAKVPALPVG
ncbi:MAG: PIN domain-containing protein [Myxococcota bacterium]